ncbi:hypothetical protein [Streptomyces sp. JB150]|uniref:hypothetical protein n=1 Tax=Streptomyces sp. JB150 TaxID=2714844 RepID=UPI0019D1C018|nr:hypothetical protein [Streptomyces sp. JB150]
MGGLPACRVEVGDEHLEQPARDSVGGRPYLEEGQPWPECFCGARMTLFFQLDVPADVEVFGGDHLLVFHCGAHNDATDPPVAGGRLVPRYWEAPQPPYPAPFWRVLVQGPEATAAEEAEPAVCARPLRLVPFRDSARWAEFKVGGRAVVGAVPESYRCACGARLAFVCQVPEGVEFAVRRGCPSSRTASAPTPTTCSSATRCICWPAPTGVIRPRSGRSTSTDARRPTRRAGAAVGTPPPPSHRPEAGQAGAGR